MKVGDLVKPVKKARNTHRIGIVIEMSGRDTLVKWTDCIETKRGQWYPYWYLRRVR